jgi:cell fate (sporulation/competence/biofilm development) regulator YmcA (YheA/YmcA/DUF963 family)
MEFIKIDGDRYMIKNSNGRIISNDEKLKLEKKELIINDIKGCDCQQETTKRIKEINEELDEHSIIEETKKARRGRNK